MGKADSHLRMKLALACMRRSEQKQSRIILSLQEPLPAIREAEDAVWSREKAKP